MTLKNNRAPLLCYFKLCASFRSHWWIQTGVTVRKHPNWVKIGDFFSHVTLKNNRAPLLSNIKLYAPFHHQMWIRTGVTVWKWLSWVMTSVTLTFDLWPWPFAWTSLLSWLITPENFVMIRWWEHSQKGVTDRRTDRQTDRRTDWTIHRAAWSQLKKSQRRTSKLPWNQMQLKFVINWVKKSKQAVPINHKGETQNYPETRCNWNLS